MPCMQHTSEHDTMIAAKELEGTTLKHCSNMNDIPD